MIITEDVSIKIRKDNINHYSKKFNCKLGDILTIHPNDLIDGCQLKIEIECDLCHTKSFLSIYKYRKNIKNGNYYGCKKCSKNKRNKTCVEKYGCEHPISLDKFKKIRENNNLEKYGVKNTLEIKEIRDNIKKTCIEKYGVDNPSKNEDIRNKTKTTCMKKYNVDTPFKSIEILNKIKQTNLKKFKTETSLESDLIKEKIKETCIIKYGVDNPWKNIEIRKKIKNTNLERYGVIHPSQSQYLYNLMIKKSLKIQKYKNTNLYYQSSYELDFLDKYFEKIEIENAFPIKYNYGINRIYYPDFYLPEYNLIVEIKSLWWYNENLNINLFKQKQCLNDGYNFIFIIDKDYQIFENIIMKK